MMEFKLYAANPTKKKTNSGNLFHALILTSREKMPSMLKVGVEKLSMFVKERPKTNKKSSNGLITETKIKSGLFNQFGDNLNHTSYTKIFLKKFQNRNELKRIISLFRLCA